MEEVYIPKQDCLEQCTRSSLRNAASAAKEAVQEMPETLKMLLMHPFYQALLRAA